ncbi:MAG: hypothetical protein EAZ06_08410 [Cytophagales bacterium]|nr:MAG: hypothetical protein EAZ06_08410 [Cytophagales bacterium]
MKIIKLGVALALRERAEKEFKNMIDDLFTKFKTKQSLFKGERKTYIAKEGYLDEPSKKNFVNVVSTVSEQLDWMNSNSKSYLNTVFNIEKTNASNTPKGTLMIGDKVLGEYSSLELLRLKSILESKLRDLYKEIPVRSEQSLWALSEEESFKAKGIFSTSLEIGEAKTTIKEQYILPDPHPDKNRQPMVADKSTQVIIGTYTSQQFSGEFSIYQRAELLVRYEKLLQATITALEEANDAPLLTSDLGDKVFDYIHSGKL